MKFRNYFFLVLIVCQTETLCSQFLNPILKRIDKCQGLESNASVDICTDKEHKYWISTYNGLQEYNGHSFKTYHLPFLQKNLLGSDLLVNIGFQNDSILWISHSLGIAKFNINSRVFELIPIQSIEPTMPLNFRSLFIDKIGQVYFLSKQSSVLKYSSKLNCFIENDKLKLEGRDFVIRMTQIPEGYYELSTRKGLMLFDPISKKIVPESVWPPRYKIISKASFKNDILTYSENETTKLISTYNIKKTNLEVFFVTTNKMDLLKFYLLTQKKIDIFSKILMNKFGCMKTNRK